MAYFNHSTLFYFASKLQKDKASINWAEEKVNASIYIIA